MNMDFEGARLSFSLDYEFFGVEVMVVEPRRIQSRRRRQDSLPSHLCNGPRGLHEVLLTA
jgi:hypothetical protein